MNKKNLINYLLLFGIGITWGSQFTFNNLAVQTLSPYAVATARTLIAGICLFILLLFINEKPSAAPTSIQQSNNKITLFKTFLIALFEAIIPFYLVAWGQQYIDSSIAAVLLGTIPIFTALLVKIFISNEKLTPGLVLSILMGFIGLIVLLWPSLIHADLTHLLAELAILAGAFSFSCALVIIKSLPNISPMRLTRNIFLIGAIPLVLNIIIFHPHSFDNLNRTNVLSLIGLGIICSACAYSMFVKLISLAGATFASLSNYLVPVFGALLGAMVLGETIYLNVIIALVIILGGLAIAKIPALNK